jgi:hypothetical protein
VFIADKPNVRTVPLDRGGWGNHFQGITPIADRGARKADVRKDARERGCKHEVEHVIPKEVGRIGERNSYGDDSPRRPG